MKYVKPELVVIAATAIRSTSKDGAQHLDLSMSWSNPPAYESDE